MPMWPPRRDRGGPGHSLPSRPDDRVVFARLPDRENRERILLVLWRPPRRAVDGGSAVVYLGAPQRWAADPRVPVEWGTLVINAFAIRCLGAHGIIPLHFCPACGGWAGDVSALAQ